MHFGEITFGVDERGEVGLLTRNIRIQASEDAETAYFGGHIMAMAGSQVQVSGVELNRMGQHLTLARYPMHWHLIGEGAGPVHPQRRDPRHLQPLRDGARHQQPAGREQRHLQHRRSLLLPRRRDRDGQPVRPQPRHPDQVSSDPALRADQPRRHGEKATQFANAAAARQASFHSGNILLPSDNTVSSFWITNPDNSYIDNVAAGSDQVGFWLSMPEHPNGAFVGTEISPNTWPRRTPLREFSGNTAHSNFDGFLIDRHIDHDNTFGLASIPLLPLTDPTDLESEVMETHFENLTATRTATAVSGAGVTFTCTAT